MGPSRTEFLKGPLSEGFPSPSTRWIGPGARIVETPPPGTRGGLFATSPARAYYPSGVDVVPSPTNPDGVPSRGLFSKTKGHFQHTERVSSPIAAADRMSGGVTDTHTAPVEDKETGENQFDETSSSEVGVVTKRSKVKRHCGKWWWLYLLGFVALVVLIVCLM